jgi:site-specific recombinase XerD
MICAVPTLRDFVRAYCLERDISDGAIEQIELNVRLLERFAGGPLRTSDLQDDLVNSFLKQLKDDGRSPHTVRSKRAAILSVWREAARRGLAEPPERVRRPKLPDRVIEAYTVAEMRSLVGAARSLRGRFRGLDMRRAVWAESFVLAYWDSALRLSDLLRIERRWIDAAGSVVIVQHKPGRVHRVAFRPETVAAIDRTMAEGPERAVVWPLWGRRDAVYDLFKKIRSLAGIERGTSKWIRRGSASAVEAAKPGSAWKHLGHSRPGLDRQAYLDPTICDPPPAPAPPIFGC